MPVATVDFEPPRHHAIVRGLADAGHEIANHTLTHAQGFRMLPLADKEREVAGMEDACAAVIGLVVEARRKIVSRRIGMSLPNAIVPRVSTCSRPAWWTSATSPGTCPAST